MKKQNDPPAWEVKRNLTPAEAAAFLACSVKTVYRLIEDGELTHFPLRGKVRGAIRIPREDLFAFERRKIEQAAADRGFRVNFVHE